MDQNELNNLIVMSFVRFTLRYPMTSKQQWVNCLEKHIGLEKHSYKNNTTTYWSNATSAEDHSITENGLIEQISRQHATPFKLEARFLREIIDIPMGTVTTPHLANLFHFLLLL